MKIDPFIPGYQYVEHNDWQIYYSPRLTISWLRDLLNLDVPQDKKESQDIVTSDEAKVLLKLESDIGFIAAKHYKKPALTKIAANTLGQDPALHNWFFAHHLNTNGINTPTPLAFMVERKMGLPIRSWYLCEFEDGIGCEHYFFNAKVITPAMANTTSAIVDMFISIRECQLSHGDLTANKLLIVDGRPCLTDMSNMKFHSNEKKAESMWRHDIEQFMNCWDERYDVYKQFKQAFLKRDISF